jgi:hypothetical protein
MVKMLRRRAAALRGVEFCDSCGEACTASCRAEARLERTRVWAAYHAPFLR